MSDSATAGSPRRLGILGADALLLVTAMIWGTTFVAQKTAAESMGPTLFTGLRYALGALLVAPLAIRGWRAMRQPRARRTALTGGLLAGLAMSAGSIAQQTGMHETSASSAGFITGLYVILVPMLGLLVGQRVRWTVWTGALLAVAGLFFLSVYDPAGGELRFNTGDIWVLACAFAWAVHVQVVGWAAPEADPMTISAVQFAVTGVVALTISWILATFLGNHPWGAREAFTWSSLQGAAWPLLFAAVLSTGVAFTLQVVAQTSAPPAHAAILLSLESVFSALAEAVCLWVGWSWLGAQMTGWKLFGCALMFIGVLVSQVRLRAPAPGSAAA